MFQRVTFGGYNVEEVDAFLAQHHEQTNAHHNERVALQAQLEQTKQQLNNQQEQDVLIAQLHALFAERAPEVLEKALLSRSPECRGLVISLLKPEQAAHILSMLSPAACDELLKALLHVQMVHHTDALGMLRDFVSFFGIPEEKHVEVGGRAWLHSVVHEAGAAGPSLCQIVEDMGQATLAESLRTQLLTVKHLTRWTTAMLQTLLQEVSYEALLITMAKSPEEFADAVLNATSKRMAMEMAEDLAVMRDAFMDAKHIKDAETEVLDAAAKLLNPSAPS